jgi:hypothetical protein
LRTPTHALGWGKHNAAKIRFASEGPALGRRWNLNPLFVRGWHFDRYDANHEPILFSEDQLLDKAFLQALSAGDIHGGCLGAQEIPDGKRELVDCFALTQCRRVRYSLVAWRMPESQPPAGECRQPEASQSFRYHIEVGFEKTAFVAMSAVGTLVNIDLDMEYISAAVSGGPQALDAILKGLDRNHPFGCKFELASPDLLPVPAVIIAERVEKYRARARL